MYFSQFFDDFLVRNLVYFTYTIVYGTFNIVGDYLTFMVTKVAPNGTNEKDGTPIYYSPIVYCVHIPVQSLEAVIQRILGLVDGKTIMYRSFGKGFDDDPDFPLSAFWSTPLDIKKKGNNAIYVETLGNHSSRDEIISKTDIRKYAYTILQAYFNTISSLATDLKIRCRDISNITITKYFDEKPVREMGEEEFWEAFDEYIGRALYNLSTYGNNVVFPDPQRPGIAPVCLF